MVHTLLLSVRLHPQDCSEILVDALRVMALAASGEQAGLFLGDGCAKHELVSVSSAERAGFPANFPSDCSDLAELLVHGQSSDEEVAGFCM
jgi:hypothetical protein